MREYTDSIQTDKTSDMSLDSIAILGSEALGTARRYLNEHSKMQDAMVLAGVLAGAYIIFCGTPAIYCAAASAAKRMRPSMMEMPEALFSIAKRTTNRSAFITANTVERPVRLNLPPMDATGRLPSGQYHMNWEEFVSKFVNTERRHHLSEGMLAALNDLRKAGAKEVEVGGSFVSRKPDPADFDMVWNAQGVIRSRLPKGIGYDSHALYGGHIFEAETPIYGLKGITTSTQLIRTARSGERFGTAVIDLTRDLPKAKRLFETIR